MGNEYESKRDIAGRCLRFAVQVLQLAGMLPKTEIVRVLIRQFVRSGTSIGANVEEAQDAASKKDFINKTSIALREARETLYWLKLMKSVGLSGDLFDQVYRECGEICAILVVIVKNAKK